ncbi:MAG: hypothetical protein Q8P50_11305 [Bacillota bacterium]|nr:hypothetical protein [Bacillota bacterium]
MPSPAIAVMLAYDDSMRPYLEHAASTLVETFGPSVRLLLLSDNPDDYRDLELNYEAQVCAIDLGQFVAGANAMVSDPEDPDVLSLPSESGAPVSVESTEATWLSEELELVHTGASWLTRDEPSQFLRGGQVTWNELDLQLDLARDKTSRLAQQLRTELTGRRVASRVNLYHAPGAGGTTVARRVLWDLRADYPSAVLMRTIPVETADRLSYIASITGRPILLLVDGKDVTERQVDELFEILRGRNIPVVILQVLRRFKVHTDGERTTYLPSLLSRAESQRFVYRYSQERPDRESSIRALLTSPDPRYRTAFYFGLEAFQVDFLGIDRYIAERLADLNELQLNALGFVALAHRYAQQPLPADAFAALFGLRARTRVDFARLFPAHALELLVETERGVWRTAHDLIAVEIVRRILSRNLANNQWRQNLSVFSQRFAEFCRGTSPVPSQALLEVARRTFIFRDNSELLGTAEAGADQFAQLLSEVPNSEGRLSVLESLTEFYPAEPHFWAHLGRFLSLERQDHRRALECLDNAVELSPRDGVLHHMKAMVLRNMAYGALRGAEADLEAALSFAKAASIAFEEARELSPESPHCYISEVQMIIIMLDHVGRSHPGGAVGYVSQPDVDPFFQGAFERAEDLLERVTRQYGKDRESVYEVRCRANLDSLYSNYERALQALDGLASRQGVNAPPVRRHIVWTLIRRHASAEHIGTQLSVASLRKKDVDRILDLLEQNFRDEGYGSSANLRLWLRVARFASHAPSLESVIERVSYWRASASFALEPAYYLYVLNALLAFEGSTLAATKSAQYLEECRSLAGFRRHRNTSYEWVGRGKGLQRLVDHRQLGDWDDAVEFWGSTEGLGRLTGRIGRIRGPQAGEIRLVGDLDAFFVPAKGSFARGRDENIPVSFYLGFSYDGPRAWMVQPE